MLEIFAIIKLTKMLAAKAEAKGRASTWGGLLPLFWIGGEIFGFLIGAVVAPEGLAAYLVALLGAAAGAISAFLVVGMLGDKQHELTPDTYVPAQLDPANPYSPPGS